jgi:hypothetical protein
MTIARKPVTRVLDEKLAEAFIEKGGSVPSEPKDKPKRKQMPLRFKDELVEQIAASCARRTIPITRQNWVHEAILEKLKRELKAIS